MNTKTFRNLVILGCSLAAALALPGCVTFPAEQVWKLQGDALPMGIHVELGKVEGGQAPFRISGQGLEDAAISGTAQASGAGWELSPTGMDWFGNWINGWTEVHFILDGRLLLLPVEGGWRLSGTPIIDTPDKASLRYHDQYFMGDKALTKFNNRWQRIVAATDELRAKFPDAWWDRTLPVFNLKIFNMLPNFQDRVKKYLFPEVYGYDAPPAAGFKVKLAESILWNTDYSDQVIPEPLRAVRNTGTLFRDFEETQGLWHLAFAWKKLWEERIPALVIPAPSQKTKPAPAAADAAAATN